MMNPNYLENDSQMCRICCNLNDLIPLLNAENNSIIKKLRACADITIEPNDELPKYICSGCFQSLDAAYNFKIQCEFMDRKLRNLLTVAKIQTSDMVDSIIEEDVEQMDDISAAFQDDDDDIVEEDNQTDEVMYLEENVITDVEYLNEPPINEMELDKFDEIAKIETTPDQDMTSVNTILLAETKTQVGDSTPFIQVKRAFKCDTCASILDGFNEYNKHKESHGEQRYQCLTCGRWFAKRYRLSSHQKTHSGNKSFACGMCSKQYTNQGNLDRHIRVTHNKERQHICSICNKSFAQATILRQHHSVHITERDFNCDICKKAFKTEVHLKLHKLRHLPTEQRPKRKYKPTDKKYKPPAKLCICTECGKRSTNLALHRSHMKSHSGEKKYECRFCEKRFSFHQSLRNHVYLHTGEKKFKCDICDMSFRQIGHLQGHKLVHTGIKPHSCTVCGKAFSMRGNLTVHMRTHSTTVDLPFQCEFCPRKFHDASGLKRHTQTHMQKNKKDAAKATAIESDILNKSHNLSTLSEVSTIEYEPGDLTGDSSTFYDI